MSKATEHVISYDEERELRDRWDMRYMAAKHDLYTFARWFCGFDLLVERVHGPFCNFIERPVLGIDNVFKCEEETYGVDYVGPEDGPFVRETLSRYGFTDQLILLPRSSYKTTILAVALPMWLLVRNPDWTIAVMGKSDDMAIASLYAIEQHIYGNPVLRKYFGHVLSPAHNAKWSAFQKFIGGRKRLGREPSLWATSIASFKPSFHFNAIIVDDPIDGRTCESEELMENADRRFEEIVPVLDPPRLRWVVGTRWGIVDLYHKLMQMRTLNKHGKRVPLFDRYIRAVYNPDGTLWFPEKFSEEEIAKIRASCRTKYIFSSQYLMHPIPPGEQSLNAENILYYKTGEHPSDVKTVIGIDPADVRGGVGSGNWAIWVLGVDSQHHFWDLELVKAPLRGEKAAEHIVKLCHKWKPSVVIVESSVISRAWIDGQLLSALRRGGIHVSVETVSSHSRGKTQRIIVDSAMGGVIEQKRLHLREDNYSVLHEVQTFSVDSDEMFDALDVGSYVVEWVGAHQSFVPRRSADVQPKKERGELQDWFDECDKALQRRDLRMRGGGKTWLKYGVRTGAQF